MISSSPIHNKEKHRSHWFVVATVCIGAFMAALDASIINVALPKLEQQFHTEMNQIEWVILSYLLSLASTILIFGSNNDLSRLVFTFRSAYFIIAVFSLLALFITYKNYKDEFKNMGDYHSNQVEVNR